MMTSLACVNYFESILTRLFFQYAMTEIDSSLWGHPGPLHHKVNSSDRMDRDLGWMLDKDSNNSSRDEVHFSALQVQFWFFCTGTRCFSCMREKVRDHNMN